jgi:hypothetical protein
MKAFARDFSMTGRRLLAAGAAVCALSGPAAALAQEATCTDAPALPPDLVAAARAAHTFPTFCSIPATPKDVRTAQGFKSAVDAIKLAKVDLARQTAPNTWSLTGSEGFAAGARDLATPPPPMSSEGDTDAFLRAMKKRATPPPRPR